MHNICKVRGSNLNYHQKKYYDLPLDKICLFHRLNKKCDQVLEMFANSKSLTMNSN